MSCIVCGGETVIGEQYCKHHNNLINGEGYLKHNFEIVKNLFSELFKYEDTIRSCKWSLENNPDKFRTKEWTKQKQRCELIRDELEARIIEFIKDSIPAYRYRG